MTLEAIMLIALLLNSLFYIAKIVLHSIYMKKMNILQTKFGFLVPVTFASILSFVPIPLLNVLNKKNKFGLYGNLALGGYYLIFIVTFLYILNTK